MRRSFRYTLALWMALAAVPALVTASETAEGVIDIPYTQYVLDNGLTLIVHEDHKAPIVAVNVWYHVGSKNEKEGKTGFAHLFEHLMFNGTENYNDDWFKPFDRVGATGMNGTTNFDRTNYFQVVPKNALDFALWMESDRMGHLLGAVDQVAGRRPSPHQGRRWIGGHQGPRFLLHLCFTPRQGGQKLNLGQQPFD